MTVQKSKAASIITIMKVSISLFRMAFRKRNAKTLPPLKATWKRQATGLRAVEKSVSTRPSSCRCLNYSLDIEAACGVAMLRLNVSPMTRKDWLIRSCLIDLTYV